MRKYIISCALLGLSTQALAQEQLEKGKPYVRIEAGYSSAISFTEHSGTNNFNYKSKSDFVGSFGMGNYITPHTRIELLFTHYFAPKYTTSPDYTFTDPDDGARYRLSGKDTIKVNANNILVRLQEDIFKFDQGSFYGSVGVGLAQINTKLNSVGTIRRLADGRTLELSENETTETTYNPSFQLGAGVSFDAGENAKLDISYAYSDLGKTNADEDGDRKVHFKTHTVSIGIRIDM